MKVALFTDTFLPQVNGVTNTLKKLMEYFENNQVEYKIFAPKYDDETTSDQVEQYYSLRFFLYPDCRLAFPNFFRIQKTFRDFQPDLVHNMTEFGMGVAGMIHAEKFGIPSISTYTTNFSKYLKYYNLEPLEDFVDDYMAWYHDRNLMTLCATEGTRAFLQEKGISRTARFSRGIDTDFFNPNQRNVDFRRAHGLEGKLVFSYVGRISAEKNLDVLMDAYLKLYALYGDQVGLMLTGDGPYLDLCKEKLPPDTVFTGFLKGQDLARAYASADIFVCPSSTETFGNVILEAMASGRTVLGSNVGGVGENIQDQKTGLTFDSEDPEALFLAMERVLRDETLRFQLARAGRAYALTQSWDAIFDELMGHYRSAISSTALELSA